MRHATALLALVCLASSVVALPARAVPPTPTAPTALETMLHDAFTQYRSWGRVDDELRWAPWLCRMPLPSAARQSAAGADTPHGQKVFFVYARDRDAYLATTRRGAQAPVGEVVVKESFHPHQLARGEQAPLRAPERPGAPFAYSALQRDGHSWGPGEFFGLYVLAKTGARGSDHGWEYGTMTPDGAITAAGHISSCMGCHDGSDTHDRLFGLDGGYVE